MQKRIISRSKPPAGRLGGQHAEAQAIRNLHKRKSARRADELIRRQQGDEDEDDRRAPGGGGRNLAKELQFFERVKARIRNREAYQDFLKCLNLFAQEVITKQELQGLVHDIIGRSADLVAGFNDFLNRCEVLDFEVDSKAVAGRMGKDMHKFKQMAMQDKYATKPISELDVSTWQRCTPSYVMLPKGYPRFTCGGRRKLGEAIAPLLNDTWVSVTSGSEDYSFKVRRDAGMRDAARNDVRPAKTIAHDALRNACMPTAVGASIHLVPCASHPPPSHPVHPT